MAVKANEPNKVEATEATAETPPNAEKKLVPVGVVDEAGKPVEDAAWEVLPPADVAYYYVQDKNPTGASYPGVPLRDLLASEVATYPKWIQRTLKKSDMYQAAQDVAKGEEE